MLHATGGELEAARIAHRAAVEADPGNLRYRENLGDLYAGLAAEAYGRAAELGDASGRTEAKRRRIEELLADPRAAEQAVGSEDPAPPGEEASCEAAFAALGDWATAWAKQDVDGYLEHYADAFQPPGGQAGWPGPRPGADRQGTAEAAQTTHETGRNTVKTTCERVKNYPNG